MNRALFFNELRASKIIFGPTLTPGNVKGTEAILDAALGYGVDDPHHIANMMAEVYHETGSGMMPVKETVYITHKDKNPSDKVVIERLNTAFAKGQLPWVKTPYWRDGWFGRGQVQVTHEGNYRKLGDAIGVDLVGDRDAALDLGVSAKIVVVGMTKGLFTGKKLSDYKFPEDLGNPPKYNPRRIINGEDGTDARVAGFHMAFYKALLVAGFKPAAPKRTRTTIIAEIEALLAELKTIGD